MAPATSGKGSVTEAQVPGAFETAAAVSDVVSLAPKKGLAQPSSWTFQKKKVRFKEAL